MRRFAFYTVSAQWFLGNAFPMAYTDTRWRYGAFCYAFWFLWFLLATLCPLREFGSML